MKIDRLIGIITILLQNGKTTAPYLAERFEVSRRTILRDLDTLCQAGIPIITEQGGRGGISIMEGYQLDRSLLTADELQRLIAGLKSIDSVSKRPKTDNLLLKLAPNNTITALADFIMIDLSSHYKDSLSEKISLIKEAITSHRMISFDYYYRKGQVKRKVEPYFVVFKWTAWYVLGWCTERADFRLFKLNRLWDLNITDVCFHSWSSFYGDVGGYYAIMGGMGTGTHTYQNILREKEFCINFVSPEYYDGCIKTISENSENADEFEVGGFAIEPSKTVKCPRIKEAFLSFECMLQSATDLSGKGICALIVGQVQLAAVEENNHELSKICSKDGFMFNVHSPKSAVTGEGQTTAVAILDPVRIVNE